MTRSDTTSAPSLNGLTITQARRLLDDGTVSALELVEALLAVIDATEPLVHAYTTVIRETALDEALASDQARARGISSGALMGIPFAAKDIFFTRDAPTEAGSKILDGFRPSFDATAVRLAREAGGILLGKQVTHEFACGQDVPPTRNAWSVEHYPGGSSAGSGVAVAVGSALFSIAEDAGGSTRNPACLNGVVGLKPTFGRVSRHGMISGAPTLDHVGIIARTVEDCALVLEVIAGPDEFDHDTISEPVEAYSNALRQDVKGVRLGVSSYFFGSELDPEVRKCIDGALEELRRLGIDLVEVDLPSLRHSLPAGFTILAAESGFFHRKWLDERPHDYVDGTRRFLEFGLLLPAAHVAAAQRLRSVLRTEMRSAFSDAGIDALVTPTLPRTSMPLDQMVIADHVPKYVPYTFPANLTGQPAVTIPCGFSSHRLPVGLQLIGRPFGESELLRIAYAYEQATHWHEMQPEVPPPAI